MLKVKLFIRGKKNQRTYRIVVDEARSKRGGSYVDDLGYWIPHTKELKIDKKKLKKWLDHGAQMTDGVRKLLEKKEEGKDERSS